MSYRAVLVRLVSETDFKQRTAPCSGIIWLGAVAVLVSSSRPAPRSWAFRHQAAPERASMNDFHAWAAWSPYEKRDKELRKTFEGPSSGGGAVCTWAGETTGEGKMTLEKSDRPSRIEIKLEFFKPMSAVNKATFTFEPVPEGTKITWAMDGDANFVGKAMSLVMDMDGMIGGDFERGLAELKALAEKSAANVAAH